MWWCQPCPLPFRPACFCPQGTLRASGHSLVYLAIDNQLAGAIELVPTIRPEAKHIVSTLKQRNMSIVIISGDHEQPTKKLAASLGIEPYFAETLPENKADLVEQLQKACPDEGRKGKTVCFPPRVCSAQCGGWHQ